MILSYFKGTSNPVLCYGETDFTVEVMLIHIMHVILTKASPPQVMCLLLLDSKLGFEIAIYRGYFYDEGRICCSYTS